ncbi:MAG: hypothetical protein FJ271_09130 [Planctomycetes bacterium]|nr:hypothetical protein [Planctomycetota bacterium]
MRGGRIMLALMWLAGAATPALAQGRVSIAPEYSPIIQLPNQHQGRSQSRDALADAVTFVSFIDNALPRTQARMFFDSGTRVRRPGRAEYFQPTGGLPGSLGPPLPETSIDYQDLRTYGEVAVLPRFSTFINTGFRWVNPDVNRNDGGFGDMDLGIKLAMLSLSDLLLTFQLRAYVPSASSSALGTEHFSFEPALLVNYQVLPFLTLEGEGRFWAPVGGGDFAGNVTRYGLGVSYRQPSDRQFWIAPVAEAIGWTVLSGQAMAVTPSGTYSVEDATGTTIFNMFGGLRVGWGDRASFYAGYGRALTGPTWYKDLWRLELRFFF